MPSQCRRFFLLLFLAACRLCTPAASRADAYAAAVLADEPAAYFRLTETNGAYYSLVNAHTATAVGSVTRGAVGSGCRNSTLRQARLFDGLGPDNVGVSLINSLAPGYGIGTQYILGPDAPDLNPGTNSLTLEAWIFLPACYTAAGEGFVIAKIGHPTTIGYVLATRLENNAMCVYGRLVDADSGETSSFNTPYAAVSTGAWHHVAAVFQRNPPGTDDVATIYVNGAAQGATTGSLSKIGNAINGLAEPIETLAPLGIGVGVKTNGAVLGYAMSGFVDEVAIYRRAMDAEAISTHYEAAAGAWRRSSTAPAGNHLVAALSRSAITSSTGRVAFWIDESAIEGYQDFAQPTEAFRPDRTELLMPNNRTVPALGFTSTLSHYLELTANSAMDGNTWTWFIVFRHEGANAVRVLIRSAYSSGTPQPTSNAALWGTYLQANTVINAHSRQLSGTLVSTVQTPASANQWAISSGNWNGTADSLNGVEAGTLIARLRDAAGTVYPPFTTGATAAATGHVRTRVGLNSSDTQYAFNGKIVEILLYNTALSASDVSAVEQYLSSKYLRSGSGTLLLIR